MYMWASLVAQTVKASARNAGDPGSILGSGRTHGEGNGNPLQYPCLENPMERGAWWATVHGVAESRTRLSDFTFFHFQSRYYDNILIWLIKTKPYQNICRIIPTKWWSSLICMHILWNAQVTKENVWLPERKFKVLNLLLMGIRT